MKNLSKSVFTFMTIGLSVLGMTKIFASDAPQLSVDSSGNGIAVWETMIFDSTRKIMAANYDQSTDTWSPSGGQQLSEINIDLSNIDSFLPRLAVDNAGNAIAVWTAFDATNSVYGIFATTYDASIPGWTGTVARLSGDTESVDPGQRVTITSTGTKILVVWSAFDETSNQYIHARAGAIDNTWLDEQTISGP